jgi:hypothetical protein
VFRPLGNDPFGPRRALPFLPKNMQAYANIIYDQEAARGELLHAMIAGAHCPAGVAGLHPRIVAGALSVIPVEINVSGPYDFVVDTGAQVTTLDRSLTSEFATQIRGHNRSGRGSDFQSHRICLPGPLYGRNALGWHAENARRRARSNDDSGNRNGDEPGDQRPDAFHSYCIE